MCGVFCISEILATAVVATKQSDWYISPQNGVPLNSLLVQMIARSNTPVLNCSDTNYIPQNVTFLKQEKKCDACTVRDMLLFLTFNQRLMRSLFHLIFINCALT